MIFYLLPCYNEEKALPKLLPKVVSAGREIGQGFRMLCVDDGSHDRTLVLLKEYEKDIPELEILKHSHNMGLGAGMKTGIKRFLEVAKEGDILVSLDADDTQDPRYSVQMAAEIANGADLAIASRFQSGGLEVGVPLHRRFLSHASSVFASRVLSLPGVKDYTCGYRAYSYGLLRQIAENYGNDVVSESGFSCMVELLLKSRKFTDKIVEVPFVLRYDQKEERSKMSILKTIWRTLRVMWKYR